MENTKIRLDIALVDKQLADSRNKASCLINDGYVSVNDIIINKSSYLVNETDIITIKKEEMSFVSRGGKKLKKALDVFKINVMDKVCLDIGASTGGFTDCLLQYGAKLVYAVDVGTGQLHTKLLNSDLVKSYEQTDIRDFTTDNIDFICSDLSFISVTLILNKMYELLSEEMYAVCLVKPQFEAGILNILNSKNFKKGVVKDSKIHLKTIRNVIKEAENIGFLVQDIAASPILGQSGNTEFLLLLKKSKEKALFNTDSIDLLKLK